MFVIHSEKRVDDNYNDNEEHNLFMSMLMNTINDS